MRSKVLTVLIGLLALLSGGAAQAAGWSGNVKIASIEVSHVNLQGVWINFVSPPFASHTCSAKNGQYFLGGNVDNRNKLASLATEALVNSRTVTVYWGGGCTGPGSSGYPVLLGITLK